MRSFAPFWVCVLLWLGGTSHAQEQCDVEAKLLLVPSETESAVRAFHARRETPGRVYFFDTSTLDLLSQGVTLRLRRGETADLTVKLRPPTEGKIVEMSGGKDKYKCEADLTGGIEYRSYSIQTKFAAALPETGDEIFALLSAAQKQLLKQAQVSIDWARVKRIADIESTDWQIKGQPPFPKLTLELWEWPMGEVLELSTKVGADAGSSAYTKLQQLVATKGLSPNSRQKLKTALVLEEIAGAAAH
jgi:hypothetical protein